MAYALSGYAWRGEKYRVEKQQRIHKEGIDPISKQEPPKAVKR